MYLADVEAGDFFELLGQELHEIAVVFCWLHVIVIVLIIAGPCQQNSI